MTDRYVVVKGRFGMGGRIAVMLSAYRYAKDSGRKLIVDWNDFAYYSPDRADVFTSFFAAPAVCSLPLEQLAGASVHPPEWQGKLLDYRNALDAEIMPYELCFFTPPSSKQKVNADVVVVTRNEKQSDYRRYYQELKLHTEIQERVDEAALRFQLKDAIGLQIRHGNGEYLFTEPNLGWFHEQIEMLRAESPRRPIFLTTDSLGVVEEMTRRHADVYHTSKWYPDIGTGSMHQNNDCPNRFHNGVEALVDIFLLARCTSLVICKGFFGRTARLLSEIDTDRVTVYPGKIHPSIKDKVGWSNPI